MLSASEPCIGVFLPPPPNHPGAGASPRSTGPAGWGVDDSATPQSSGEEEARDSTSTIHPRTAMRQRGPSGPFGDPWGLQVTAGALNPFFPILPPGGARAARLPPELRPARPRGVGGWAVPRPSCFITFCRMNRPGLPQELLVPGVQ